MAYHGIATVLYLTAFLANAASVHPYRFTYFYGHMAAAAVRRLTPQTLTQIHRNYLNMHLRSRSDNVSEQTLIFIQSMFEHFSLPPSLFG